MTQCISRRRGSDLRPSIMRPVCFLQPARVRHVYCVSPYPPKPCQPPPPPWAALLLTGWWVYIPTLPLSQQSVQLDCLPVLVAHLDLPCKFICPGTLPLFICLVLRVICFFCALFCSLCACAPSKSTVPPAPLELQHVTQPKQLHYCAWPDNHAQLGFTQIVLSQHHNHQGSGALVRGGLAGSAR